MGGVSDNESSLQSVKVGIVSVKKRIPRRRRNKQNHVMTELVVRLEEGGQCADLCGVGLHCAG